MQNSDNSNSSESFDYSDPAFLASVGIKRMYLDRQLNGLQHFYGGFDAIIIDAIYAGFTTIKDIHKYVCEHHTHEVQYTSIASALIRMHSRGIVWRTRDAHSMTQMWIYGMTIPDRATFDQAMITRALDVLLEVNEQELKRGIARLIVKWKAENQKKENA